VSNSKNSTHHIGPTLLAAVGKWVAGGGRLLLLLLLLLRTHVGCRLNERGVDTAPCMRLLRSYYTAVRYVAVKIDPYTNNSTVE